MVNTMLKRPPSCGEIHPAYDIGAHLAALFTPPAHRSPEHALLEDWRAVGEELHHLGELARALTVATARLSQVCATRARRRLRRRIASRAARSSRSSLDELPAGT
jgi:hypothetical protein